MTPDELVEQLANDLPGGLSTRRREHLHSLFEADSNPDAVDIWNTWQGFGPVGASTREQYRSLGDVDGFDPAEDQADTSAKVKAAQAYEAAHDEGLEDAAAYLRTLGLTEQKQFSRFLRRRFL